MELLKTNLQKWLQNHGFSAAEKQHYSANNFYRKNTEYTAFFANLKEHEDCLRVWFGLASTAFTKMSGCENSLREYGILNEDSCLRYIVFVRDEKDICAFTEQISDLIKRYEGMEKDALLQMLKDKRKGFLNGIHEVLKPYGFKKKGNEWRLPLQEGYILYFHADKSTYCDCYEFDVMIHTQTQPVHRCVYELLSLPVNPVEPQWPYRFDWQLNSQEELQYILNRLLEDYVSPAQNLGIAELRKKENIRDWSRCDRTCCDPCWMEDI